MGKGGQDMGKGGQSMGKGGQSMGKGGQSINNKNHPLYDPNNFTTLRELLGKWIYSKLETHSKFEASLVGRFDSMRLKRQDFNNAIDTRLKQVSNTTNNTPPLPVLPKGRGNTPKVTLPKVGGGAGVTGPKNDRTTTPKVTVPKTLKCELCKKDGHM